MNTKLTLLVAIAMAGTSGAAFAQASATQSTTGSTRILQAISIAQNSPLAFGSIVKPTSGSAVISIDATSGIRTVGAGAVAAAGASGRATYTVTGEGGQGFTITPAPSFTMSNAANDTITVTTSASSAAGTLSGDIGSSGTASFGVGGSFSLADTTPSGNYSGSFNVVVAYN